MQNAKESGKQMAPAENVLKVHGYYNYTFSKEEAEVVLEIAKSFMEVYAK